MGITDSAVSPASVQLRRGRAEDVLALLGIYNHEVVNGVSTLDITPKTPEQWRQWFDSHDNESYPLIVAVRDDAPVGYSCLSPYRSKEGYRPTAELSVYVHPDHRGCGVASLLMGAIIDAARCNPDIHAVMSVITGDNAPSRHLHERFDFVKCGDIHQCGFKHGRYHDIHLYELIVGNHRPDPATFGYGEGGGGSCGVVAAIGSGGLGEVCAVKGEGYRGGSAHGTDGSVEGAAAESAAIHGQSGASPQQTCFGENGKGKEGGHGQNSEKRPR